MGSRPKRYSAAEALKAIFKCSNSCKGKDSSSESESDDGSSSPKFVYKSSNAVNYDTPMLYSCHEKHAKRPWCSTITDGSSDGETTERVVTSCDNNDIISHCSDSTDGANNVQGHIVNEKCVGDEAELQMFDGGPLRSMFNNNFENINVVESSVIGSDVSSDDATNCTTNDTKSHRSNGENIFPLAEVNNNVSEENARKRKPKKQNKRQVMKCSKIAGKEYTNTKGKIVSDKKVKPNPCSEKCQNKCLQNWDDNSRQLAFDCFWNLGSLEQQKYFILSHSEKCVVKRKRVHDESRRKSTINFYLENNGKKLKVCQKFFLCTLDIGEKFVHYTMQHSTANNTPTPDKRGRHIPSLKTTDADLGKVRNFIESLPLVSSHYCRQSSSRQYLPSEFKSFANLYRQYCVKMAAKSFHPVSQKVFRFVITHEYNIGIHHPKKDKCTLCESFSNNNQALGNSDLVRLNKQKHDSDKLWTYEEFLGDQQKSSKNGVLCCSFDLEKVLNTPHVESMLLYYTRKYSVYNFTIYESGTQNGFCFLWGESDGHRGSNEICSCINHWLIQKDLSKDIDHLIMYCDSCGGQNKNRILLTMFYYAIHSQLQNIKVIEIKYLLPGHTYMPVDSMHALIDRSVKNVPIWAPHEWLTIANTARCNPKPYECKWLTHDFFLNWKSLLFALPLTLKDSNGEKMLWSQIRTATFSIATRGHFSFTYHCVKDATIHNAMINFNAKRTRGFVKPTLLYNAALPISHAKYTDLMKLVKNNTIPIIHHNFYRQLPHNMAVKNVLPAPDKEESERDTEAE